MDDTVDTQKVAYLRGLLSADPEDFLNRLMDCLDSRSKNKLTFTERYIQTECRKRFNGWYSPTDPKQIPYILHLQWRLRNGDSPPLTERPVRSGRENR